MATASTCLSMGFLMHIPIILGKSDVSGGGGGVSVRVCNDDLQEPLGLPKALEEATEQAPLAF